MINKKILDIIGSIATIAIPGGMILWLFWPDGWKISVIGAVVFISIVIHTVAVKLTADKKEND